MGRCLALLSILASCGPPCADDRCSLTPTTPQVQRVDYAHPQSGSTGTTSTMTQTGGPPGVTPVTPGSGSAPPPPPPGVGSGSAVVAPPPPPPPPPPKSSMWDKLEDDAAKASVATKGAIPANTTIHVDLVRLPERTPFLITLATIADGGTHNEAAWNNCPEGKVRCIDGSQSHTTKRAGRIAVQGGINWSVSTIADDGAKTIVTWTNNLSREQLTLRLYK